MVIVMIRDLFDKRTKDLLSNPIIPPPNNVSETPQGSVDELKQEMAAAEEEIKKNEQKIAELEQQRALIRQESACFDKSIIRISGESEIDYLSRLYTVMPEMINKSTSLVHIIKQIPEGGNNVADTMRASLKRRYGDNITQAQIKQIDDVPDEEMIAAVQKELRDTGKPDTADNIADGNSSKDDVIIMYSEIGHSMHSQTNKPEHIDSEFIEQTQRHINDIPGITVDDKYILEGLALAEFYIDAKGLQLIKKNLADKPELGKVTCEFKQEASGAEKPELEIPIIKNSPPQNDFDNGL